MNDILDKKELNKRRHLIVHHDVIHGIDFAEFVDNFNVILYFIAPENKKKNPPAILKEHLELCFINNGRQLNISDLEMQFDASLYGLKIKLDEALNLKDDSELQINLNHRHIDRFFSSTAIKLTGRLIKTDSLNLNLSQAGTKVLPRLDYLSKDYQSFKTLINN